MQYYWYSHGLRCVSTAARWLLMDVALFPFQKWSTSLRFMYVSGMPGTRNGEKTNVQKHMPYLVLVNGCLKVIMITWWNHFGQSIIVCFIDKDNNNNNTKFKEIDLTSLASLCSLCGALRKYTVVFFFWSLTLLKTGINLSEEESERGSHYGSELFIFNATVPCCQIIIFKGCSCFPYIDSSLGTGIMT